MMSSHPCTFHSQDRSLGLQGLQKHGEAHQHFASGSEIFAFGYCSAQDVLMLRVPLRAGVTIRSSSELMHGIYFSEIETVFRVGSGAVLSACGLPPLALPPSLIRTSHRSCYETRVYELLHCSLRSASLRPERPKAAWIAGQVQGHGRRMASCLDNFVF